MALNNSENYFSLEWTGKLSILTLVWESIDLPKISLSERILQQPFHVSHLARGGRDSSHSPS